MNGVIMMAQVHKFDFASSASNSFTHSWLEDGVASSSVEYQFRTTEGIKTKESLMGMLPVEEDLIEVVSALHLADLIAPRKSQKGRDYSPGARVIQYSPGARVIQVKIGVCLPELWRSSAVYEPLNVYLRFNTGDRWEIEFVEKSYPEQLCLSLDDSRTLEERILSGRNTRHGRNPHWLVALCSDGGDSWAGLADQLRKHPKAHFLLVTHEGNPRVVHVQQKLLSMMPEAARKRVEIASFSVELLAKKRRGAHASSLRTRGLLFLVGGTLASRLLGLEQFHVFENGMGAFNPAFDASQLTWQTNRAVHPYSLALFSQFASALFRTNFCIENPYLFTTKAQMWRALDVSGWNSLIGQTFSCGHAHRVPSEGCLHCGVCTSCILRRTSLAAANLSQEDAKYVYDLPTGTVPSDKLIEWVKVHQQARLISKALNAGDHSAIWNALERQWHELRDTMNSVCATSSRSHIEFQRNVINLFKRHIADGLTIGTSMPRLRDTTKPVSLFDSDSEVRAA